MNRKSGLVMTLMLALVISACKPKEEPPAPEKETTTTPPVDTSSQPAHGTKYTAEELERLFGIVGDPLNYKVVYFEYNSSAMDERSQIIATRHAQHLSNSSGTTVNLEGHADERGTRDYNLALGERRSQAVAQWMSSAGASNQIQSISYGEERPVDPGHTEEAWQKNRRVEIKY